MNSSVDQELSRDLIAITRQTAWLMDALAEAQKLDLNNWCIGAGAVRSVVWDRLHGFSCPTPISDIDLVYYDPEQLDPQVDRELAGQLPAVLPGARWEVVNQATVHSWYATTSGRTFEPFASLEEGVGSWPEYATSVGVTLKKDGSIGVVAPHGLEDLFGMIVRHNPIRATAETYQQRTAEKNFVRRWPKVVLLAPTGDA
ncbi:nucleotidyltransferase family protein [Aeoliella sp.]|uniref:nucleotidyltransferase family protein n=1 Tax=Aeoliella sp. TaxID=2795800 RepID=UPI003CCC0354